MPVNVDKDGRRWVAVETDVHADPETVWRAIATGKGISSWFVPSEVEEKVDGVIRQNFGPGMESVSHITAWQPPHRFTAESRDDVGPDDPSVATEWTVEAKAGGTCTVRIVHSWFLEDDRWDGQYEQHSWGWVGFFKILKAVVEMFPDQPCAPVQTSAVSLRPLAEAWARLTTPLGLAAPAAGQSFQAPADAPCLAGRVEDVNPPEYPNLLLTLTEPAPGIANLFPMGMGGTTFLSVRFFFFGDPAPAAVADATETEWSKWLAEEVA